MPIRIHRARVTSKYQLVNGQTAMEIGIDSFAAAFDGSSRAVSSAERIRHLIEQIEAFRKAIAQQFFGLRAQA
jgi:hypothetical protein